MFTDCHITLVRWSKLCSQLLNVLGGCGVRQRDIYIYIYIYIYMYICMYTAEPLVPEPSAFELEMAIEKLKRHIPPGTDKIPAEVIKSGRRTIRP